MLTGEQYLPEIGIIEGKFFDVVFEYCHNLILALGSFGNNNIMTSMNSTEMEEARRNIPSVFSTPSPEELRPGSAIYDYYVRVRVDSDLELLARAYGKESYQHHLHDIAVEYTLLVHKLESQGLDVSERMKFDELDILIDEIGIRGFVEQIGSSSSIIYSLAK